MQKITPFLYEGMLQMDKIDIGRLKQAYERQ